MNLRDTIATLSTRRPSRRAAPLARQLQRVGRPGPRATARTLALLALKLENRPRPMTASPEATTTASRYKLSELVQISFTELPPRDTMTRLLGGIRSLRAERPSARTKREVRSCRAGDFSPAETGGFFIVGGDNRVMQALGWRVAMKMPAFPLRPWPGSRIGRGVDFGDRAVSMIAHAAPEPRRTPCAWLDG
jgi:hypothetical protein